MVSFKELVARVQKDFRFNKAEWTGFIVGILITGFVFSFRFWGIDEFNFLIGLKNLVLTIVAAGISIFGHIACQKIFALSVGYKAEFRVWWTGLLIALVLAFLSAGYLTLVLVGGMYASFMVRQRLGQFRYGYVHEDQAIIGLWGILGSLILATGFRLGNFYFPEALFFERGMMISIIFAICSALPIPRMDGLNIFSGSRGMYLVSIILVIVAALLLLVGGGWGLLLAIIMWIIAAIMTTLYGSEV